LIEPRLRPSQATARGMIADGFLNVYRNQICCYALPRGIAIVFVNR
jgi:hypothetical protein